ncbi:MAG: lytic transglycosylase domain-containing protein [Paenibacillaceae bacterium]
MFFAFLRKKRVFILLFISLVGLLFYGNDWLGRWIYPIHYQDEIRSASSQSQLDPFLVSAIIRVESNFKSDKISSKGAIGLMQLMPDTAEWITNITGSAENIANRLTIPEVNIQVGTWYISSLQKQFEQRIAKMDSNQDRIALVAAAYNAGPGNVNKWLEDGTWDGSYGKLAYIPFGETRHFVQRILYYYKKHERYYSEIWYNRES